MLRSSKKLFTNVASVSLRDLDCHIQNNIVKQSVRWVRARKPAYLGTAKTKVFRVAPRPVLEESEYEELKHLYYRYKTRMRSIYNYMKEENMKMADGSKQLQEEEQQENEHFRKCLEENDRWNKECEQIRNARIAEQRLEKEMDILQTSRKMNILKEEQQLEWEEKVVKEMELSKTYITEEKLDDAVRRAMEEVTDFNFAITLQGQKIIGGIKTVEERSDPNKSAQANV